jgi:hypothetical protein
VGAVVRDGLLLVPETFLTKICIVSSTSEVVLEMLEMLAERRMVAVAVAVALCGRGAKRVKR